MRTDDISDPALRAAAERFLECCANAADWNSPLETRDGGGSGKPGSMPPGRQGCPWLVRYLIRAADNAVTNMESARVRERSPQRVDSMGGIPIPTRNPATMSDTPIALLARRSRRVGTEHIEAHCTKKLTDAIGQRDLTGLDTKADDAG